MIEARICTLAERKMCIPADRKLHEIRIRPRLTRQVEHAGIERDGSLQIACGDRHVVDARALKACLSGKCRFFSHAERNERPHEFTPR